MKDLRGELKNTTLLRGQGHVLGWVTRYFYSSFGSGFSGPPQSGV